MSAWTLEESNVYYNSREEYVTDIEDISTDHETKFILTLDSGTQRLITQHDLDNDCLLYCKYMENIRKIMPRDENE